MLPSGTVLTTDENPTNTATTHPVQAAATRNPVHPEEEDSSLEGLGGLSWLSSRLSPGDRLLRSRGVF
jgi:hypothetical protein